MWACMAVHGYQEYSILSISRRAEGPGWEILIYLSTTKAQDWKDIETPPKVYPASGRRFSKKVPVNKKSGYSLTLHVLKGDFVGPGRWSVINYPTKNESLDWGLHTYNQQSQGRWCPLIWMSPPPRTLQWAKTLPVLKSTLCPHSHPVLRVSFWCNLVYVSCVFWLFFQANLILINHPHWPNLAKSDCRKVVVKHSINPNKWNAIPPPPVCLSVTGRCTMSWGRGVLYSFW